MTKRLLTIPTAMLLAAGVAACGSTKAAGIVPVPSGGLTVAAATTPAATTPTTPTTPTTTTPAVATPTSGPLSKEPAIAAPKGRAPAKLEVKDLIKGTGPVAGKTSSVTVNYVGALYSSGKVFDASWNHKQTFPFTLGQGAVIPGWDEGVPGMRVGGRRELIIPASLAYGKSGRPPTIPPNAPLVFIVDLLKVS